MTTDVYNLQNEAWSKPTARQAKHRSVLETALLTREGDFRSFISGSGLTDYRSQAKQLNRLPQPSKQEYHKCVYLTMKKVNKKLVLSCKRVDKGRITTVKDFTSVSPSSFALTKGWRSKSQLFISSTVIIQPLSTHLIKPVCFTLPPTQHHSFFIN